MSAHAVHEPGQAEAEKRAAARNSVFAAVVLTVFKLVVGLLTLSLGILAEAAHSLLDFVAALITYLAVRVSGKPADHDHTYGHGKVENFSALIETVLLFVTCAWIIYEAVQRLFFKGVDVDPSMWGFLVMAVAIGIDVSRSRMLYRVAREHRSQALEADALHFSTDVWSSSVVIVGLAFVWIGKNVFPAHSKWLAKADAVAAVGVAFIVLFVSYKLGKQTVDVLLDRAPEGLIQQFREAAAAIDGVLSIGQVRVRRSGPRLFVDMSVDVDRNLSFERTHAIAEAVEARIEQISPGADAVIHTDPREVERESMARRIRAVAFRNQMSVHNISMHEEQGQVYVDLHLEVDDHFSLQQAHEMATHVERDLLKDMGVIAQIYTHLESRGTGMGDGKDVTAEEGDVVARIKSVTDEIAGAGSCHDVMIRRHGTGLAVSLHCHFPEHLSIVDVHDRSSKIEVRLKERIPGVDYVLVHAEPRAPAGS